MAAQDSNAVMTAGVPRSYRPRSKYLRLAEVLEQLLASALTPTPQLYRSRANRAQKSSLGSEYDTVRAPYNTTGGNDFVKSLRL